MPWHLYVIRTTDQKLYAGVTTDVQRRFREHLSQGRRTARYLRAHKPKALVFSQVIGDRSSALRVEYWFKRLSRERKEKVIRAGRLRIDGQTG
jgi:putative endonuclease